MENFIFREVLKFFNKISPKNVGLVEAITNISAAFKNDLTSLFFKKIKKQENPQKKVS